MIEELEGGRIYACIDVTDPEPPEPGSPLYTLPNCLLTPHVAWYSEESQAELRRRVADDVGRALNGLLPRGLVNREVGNRFTAERA